MDDPFHLKILNSTHQLVAMAVDPAQTTDSAAFLVNAVSKGAICITIGLFSSGILTCRKIHNSKSVGAVPHLPFVAAFTNCCLWLCYGLIKPDSSISLVNSVGLALQLTYIIIYHTYSDSKYAVRRDFSISMSIIVTMAVYFTFFVTEKPVAVARLGIVCNFFTICFFASPLSTMTEVVRSQKTDSMSFPLSVMSFLTTLSWTAYGYLISDGYVLFPNFIGLLLSIVQLSLFVVYRNQNQSKTLSLASPA